MLMAAAFPRAAAIFVAYPPIICHEGVKNALRGKI